MTGIEIVLEKLSKTLKLDSIKLLQDNVKSSRRGRSSAVKISR